MPSLVFRCVIFANAAWSSSRSSSRPENAALSLLTAHQAVPVPRSARAARPSACDERRQAGESFPRSAVARDQSAPAST
jgi:hypothetical protein